MAVPHDLAPMPPAREVALLSVVAPMYNEEATAQVFYERVVAAMDSIPFELVLVEDGSKDNTRAILARIAAADARVKVVLLSRNFGHQPALTAGLEHARGDVVVMIDADLQDPPELIPKMLEQWRAGGRRRLRRAGSTRGRDAGEAVDRRAVLQALSPAGEHRPGCAIG